MTDFFYIERKGSNFNSEMLGQKCIILKNGEI